MISASLLEWKTSGIWNILKIFFVKGHHSCNVLFVALSGNLKGNI